MCMHACVHACARARVIEYTHANTHTRMQTHIHTYICTRRDMYIVDHSHVTVDISAPHRVLGLPCCGRLRRRPPFHAAPNLMEFKHMAQTGLHMFDAKSRLVHAGHPDDATHGPARPSSERAGSGCGRQARPHLGVQVGARLRGCAGTTTDAASSCGCECDEHESGGQQG